MILAARKEESPCSPARNTNRSDRFRSSQQVEVRVGLPICAGRTWLIAGYNASTQRWIPRESGTEIYARRLLGRKRCRWGWSKHPSRVCPPAPNRSLTGVGEKGARETVALKIMRPLLINSDVLARIKALKEHAERERFTFGELQAIIAGRIPPPGDDPRFVIMIPFGFRVVYTIEEQKPPLGWCHHLSISVDRKEKYPHEQAVFAIAQAFGMPVTKPEDAILHLEKEVQAVNVILPLTGKLPS